jgi:hypothetical protein
VNRPPRRTIHPEIPQRGIEGPKCLRETTVLRQGTASVVP